MKKINVYCHKSPPSRGVQKRQKRGPYKKRRLMEKEKDAKVALRRCKRNASNKASKKQMREPIF